MEENKTDNNIEKETEQLNTPSTDETIVPTAETIPEVEQPITHNPKPETSNDMEVHHHSHESHGKKNWKSYFWEFLMLFLAVFCGFLAEYQLEHTIEKDREKQYIRSGKKLSCIVFIHEFVLMYKLSTYIYMIKL